MLAFLFQKSSVKILWKNILVHKGEVADAMKIESVSVSGATTERNGVVSNARYERKH